MEATTFDELGSTPADSRKPFFAINLNSEDEVHTWLKDTLARLKADSYTRLEKVKNNYLRYKNIQYINQLYGNRDSHEGAKTYNPQMVMPLIKDGIDEKVARMMESKPSFTVIPKDDEEKDKVDSKIAKRFLSHLEYQEKLPAKFRDWLKNAGIAGESFLWPRWNPDKGPKLAEQEMLDQPLSRSLRIGDIEYKLFDPNLAFYEEHPSKQWENVNYIFLIEYEYTEGLKRDYPSIADKINPESVGNTIFDFDTLEEKPLEGFTAKVHFIHKPMKYLESGYYACFCAGALFKQGPIQEEYQDLEILPVVRLIPGKNENELHGESSIEPVKDIAAEVNDSENMISKHLKMLANTKIFVEKGAVDVAQLNNDIGIVELKKGSQAPVMPTPAPVSPQLIERSERLSEKFYMYMKSNSVVRGEPPEGVTAFVAMQYLSEAESRRLSSEVQLFQEAVVTVYQISLNVVAVKYKPGQPRTMWVAGKDNQWNMLKYDPETLKKKFSVMIQNATGLPDSKAGRIQATLELEERFPGIVPREQVLEMTGFAQTEKFVDVATSATRSAEEENEHMLDGKGVIEPAAWEDHVIHWNIHAQAMQNLSFKLRASPQVIQDMESHLMATEMMMLDQMTKSDGFAQKVMTLCPQFPMLFKIPQVPMMMPPPEAPMEGPSQAPNKPLKKESQKDMTDQTMAGGQRQFPTTPPPQAQQPL